MSTISVRYIVDDVDDAINFYAHHLDFEVVMHPAPGFAMLARGDLRLLLNVPGSGGGGTGADGQPTPGGWNRFQIDVDDLDDVVARMADAGVRLRSAIIQGNGGRQVLADDPSGNPVELFETAG